jgi:hypothetical protein
MDLLLCIYPYETSQLCSDSLEQGSSWKADRRWAGQEMPPPSLKSDGYLPCLQDPATGPYLEPVESSSYHHTLFKIRHNIVPPPHLWLGLASGAHVVMRWASYTTFRQEGKDTLFVACFAFLFRWPAFPLLPVSGIIRAKFWNF